MYSIARGWIDTAGKTRTWFLLDPSGKRVAEVTTKRAAECLVALLSQTH